MENMEYVLKSAIDDITINSVVENGEYYTIDSTGNPETDERLKNYIIDSIAIINYDEPLETTDEEQYYVDLFYQDFMHNEV